MVQYNYKAVNALGRTVRGSITAGNEIDLEDKLKNLNLYLIDYKENNMQNIEFFSTVTHKELILFCLQLEQLEKAGVPILESLSDLRESVESIKMKNVIAEIIEAIKGGTILSAALAAHPKVFNEVFIGLVKAGENTGQLHIVFHHLGEHLKWLHQIKTKIKKAINYPMFLLLLMCSIVSLMMLFVIPKLSGFLSAQNFELPTYTKALITTSNAFQNYWYLIFGLPILSIIALKISMKIFEPLAFLWDNIKLYLPIIGPTIRKIEMARFCRFFAITFKSGIGILECLDIANNVVMNKIIKESIISAREEISTGQSLTAALKATGQFPNLVMRMIKIGEDSGNLDQTLENVNFFYDKEVADSVDRMLGSIQPALTIILGSIMFWITAAVFGPLYSSFSKLNI
ncbi:MAG: type II secretion system F family protein [Alphaproteobacteria bacterium]